MVARKPPNLLVGVRVLAGPPRKETVMLDEKHPLLKEKEDVLRKELEHLIDKFENETGVFVTYYRYHKTQQTLSTDLETALIVPKGCK